MPPRLLDATASDFLSMNGRDLAESIRLAEGRTLAVEVIGAAEPPVEGVSHGELAAAMGADIITLDQFDPFQPVINGAPPAVLQAAAPLQAYKRLLGRPVGINLIAADAEQGAFLGGRLVSEASIERAGEQGAGVIFLYARPKLGGTLAMQAAAAQAIRHRLGEAVLLVGVPSFSKPPPRDTAGLDDYRADIHALLDAGCDGIGLPMPGSKQGWLNDEAARLVDDIHRAERLAWLLVTGSVEGAPPAVMPLLALAAKQIGADVVRLDEAGLSGMPPPDNILAFSLALRGQRHTYRRMAASILR